MSNRQKSKYGYREEVHPHPVTHSKLLRGQCGQDNQEVVSRSLFYLWCTCVKYEEQAGFIGIKTVHE